MYLLALGVTGKGPSKSVPSLSNDAPTCILPSGALLDLFGGFIRPTYFTLTYPNTNILSHFIPVISIRQILLGFLFPRCPDITESCIFLRISLLS